MLLLLASNTKIHSNFSSYFLKQKQNFTGFFRFLFKSKAYREKKINLDEEANSYIDRVTQPPHIPTHATKDNKFILEKAYENSSEEAVNALFKALDNHKDFQTAEKEASEAYKTTQLFYHGNQSLDNDSLTSKQLNKQANDIIDHIPSWITTDQAKENYINAALESMTKKKSHQLAQNDAQQAHCKYLSKQAPKLKPFVRIYEQYDPKIEIVKYNDDYTEINTNGPIAPIARVNAFKGYR